MPFLLLLLLAAIGLVITLAGYLLTPRNQLRPLNQRTPYQTDYYVNRGGRRARAPIAARNVRYVAVYSEESTWTWADVCNRYQSAVYSRDVWASRLPGWASHLSWF